MFKDKNGTIVYPGDRITVNTREAHLPAKLGECFTGTVLHDWRTNVLYVCLPHGRCEWEDDGEPMYGVTVTQSFHKNIPIIIRAIVEHPTFTNKLRLCSLCGCLDDYVKASSEYAKDVIVEDCAASLGHQNVHIAIEP